MSTIIYIKINTKNNAFTFKKENIVQNNKDKHAVME